MRITVATLFSIIVITSFFSSNAQADDFDEFRRMKTGWRQMWLDPADPRNSKSICRDHPKSLGCKAETMLTCEFRELPELCRTVADESAIPDFSNGPLPRPSGDYLEYHLGGSHVNSRKEAAQNPTAPLWAEGVASIDIVFAACQKGKRCSHKILSGDAYHLHRISGEWVIFVNGTIVDMSDTVLP